MNYTFTRRGLAKFDRFPVFTRGYTLVNLLTRFTLQHTLGRELIVVFGRVWRARFALGRRLVPVDYWRRPGGAGFGVLLAFDFSRSLIQVEAI